MMHYLEKKESLLFNLTKDPDERNNLIENEPEIGKHLQGLIYEKLKELNKRFRKGNDAESE